MAKKSKGWVLIDRKLYDNEIWKRPEIFCQKAAWIDLILMVNHEDVEITLRNGKTMKIPRGSTLTTYRHLADRWHWSIGKVQRFLAYLNDTQSVTLNDTGSGTLLSLVKYEDFQGARYTKRYSERYKDEYRTKNERKNEKKKSAFSRPNNRPAPLEERFAAIERNAMKEGGD